MGVILRCEQHQPPNKTATGDPFPTVILAQHSHSPQAFLAQLSKAELRGIAERGVKSGDQRDPH